jgi:glutamyl-tRNA synthetase
MPARERPTGEDINLGVLFSPGGTALPGGRVRPPLFGSIRLLGEQKCLARIDRALKALEKTGAVPPALSADNGGAGQ